jgi:glycine/D-amino acid oxidase-like deaminating enzyme
VKTPGFLHRRRPLEADVAVVGSGLPALAAALEIQRRGARVLVLGSAPAEERPRGLGLVLLGPGRPYSAVARAIGRPSAQLVWAAGCENHLRLRALVEETRRACGYQARGSFLLAASREEAAELALSEDMLRDDGFPGEFLDHYMLGTHFDLAAFAGAYWAAEDAEVDAGLLLGALGERARGAGVAFSPGPVRAVSAGPEGARIETEEGPVRAATLLVATDAPVAHLLPALRPVLRPAAPGRLRAPLLEGARLPAAARTADGRFGWHAGPSEVAFAALDAEPPDLEALATRVPVELGQQARRWDEEGETTLDGLPLVGRVGGATLAVSCGFGATAPGLAFAAARWAADALVSGTDPTPDPLRADRVPAAV